VGTTAVREHRLCVRVPPTIRVIDDRWTTIRHAVEAVAIVAAGLWAAYVFIYQERIKPALEPPSLQLTARFDPGTVVRGTRVATLSQTFENTGHVDTDVYAETLGVFGTRYDLDQTRTPAPLATSAAEMEENRTVVQTRGELVYAVGTLRDAAIGGKTGTHILLTPGEHITLSYPIAVKEGRFDALTAELVVIYGRAYPERHHFAHITLTRAENGQLFPERPARGSADDGDEIDFPVTTAL